MMMMDHQMVRSPPSDPAGGRFSYFMSAPTSPSRGSEFYRDFDDFTAGDQDFSFHVGAGESDSASELFHHGLIRSPLAQTPDHAHHGSPSISAVGSTRSNGRRKSFWSNLIAAKKKKHVNPYARVAEDNTARGETEEMRGRERGPHPSTSARRGARSLSPTRAPEKTGSRKWRLRNFLLFRSASEGRASDKDPIASFCRRSNQDGQIKGSNSTENKNMRRVSAHERHYTVNRAASEDLKKKTFLPYKQGILGRMAVNPTAHHVHTSSEPAPEADHHMKKCLRL